MSCDELREFYEDELLKPLRDKEQAAKYLKTSVPTIDRLRSSGELRSVKIGNLVRFRPEDLAEFVERNAK